MPSSRHAYQHRFAVKHITGACVCACVCVCVLYLYVNFFEEVLKSLADVGTTLCTDFSKIADVVVICKLEEQ